MQVRINEWVLISDRVKDSVPDWLLPPLQSPLPVQLIVLEVVQDKVIESAYEIAVDEEVKVLIIGLIDIIGSELDEPPPPPPPQDETKINIGRT